MSDRRASERRNSPCSLKSVRGLAAAIQAVGLLQNLIVHSVAVGISGLAAGSRRLTALNLWAHEGRLPGGYSVMVKRVSDDIVALTSVAESEQRADIHPAERIADFRSLADQAKHSRRLATRSDLAPAKSCAC